MAHQRIQALAEDSAGAFSVSGHELHSGHGGLELACVLPHEVEMLLEKESRAGALKMRNAPPIPRPCGKNGGAVRHGPECGRIPCICGQAEADCAMRVLPPRTCGKAPRRFVHQVLVDSMGTAGLTDIFLRCFAAQVHAGPAGRMRDSRHGEHTSGVPQRCVAAVLLMRASIREGRHTAAGNVRLRQGQGAWLCGRLPGRLSVNAKKACAMLIAHALMRRLVRELERIAQRQ